MSEKPLPSVRSKWKDVFGDIYTVVLITNLALKAKYTGRLTHVVYVDKQGNFWSSPFIYWHEDMTLVEEEI